MLKPRLVLKLTAEQIAALQPLIQEAEAQKSIICGSVEFSTYDCVKLAVVDRETALQIEALAKTQGEETNVRQITSANRRDVEKAENQS